MGAQNASLSQICGSQTSQSQVQTSTQINTEISQQKNRRATNYNVSKPKSNPVTETYQQVDDDYDNTTNYESDDSDQKYDEQEYAQMEREVKASKNEIQRVITQYNLQLGQAKNKFTKLQEKFHDELQQKSVLLQQLQDLIKQNETLKSSQITINLECEAEINEYKVSIAKLQQQLTEYNAQNLLQTQQYETEINKCKQSITNLTEKMNEYSQQISQQNKENIKLTESNTQLQNTLNKQTQNEKTNIIYTQKIETLQNELNEYKQSQINEMDMKTEEITQLKSEIIQLKSTLQISEDLNTENMTQINALKSDIIVLKSANENNIDILHLKEEKEDKLTNVSKKKEKSLSDTQRQMEVLYNENAKAKSLFLCCKTEWIDGKDMSFTKWLSKHMNDKTVQTLWKKLKSEKVNGHIFVSLLATTTMIYKTKIFQLRTKTKNRPNIDTVKLKRYVEHLGVWCIRNKGIQMNEKRNIYIETEFGEIINEEVYKYKLSLTQKEFANNLAEWVNEYIECEGIVENVI